MRTSPLLGFAGWLIAISSSLIGTNKPFHAAKTAMRNQALKMDWAKPCRFLKGSI